MYILENDQLKIAVKAMGAELCSILRKSDDKEYIWQADPKHWKRHAPILFPIVGGLSQDRTIKMGRHGFARDKEFECILNVENTLAFELCYDTESMGVYPYKFALRIIYILEGSQLRVQYEVENLGKDTMPFSIGAHPAFNCNLMGNTVELEFEKEENLSTLMLDLSNGLLDGTSSAIALEDRIMNINQETFAKDALVFKNLNSTWIKVIDTSTNTRVKVGFKGFPYMGIWSPKAQFVCIEPWYGVTDSVKDSGDLFNKEAIQVLGLKEVFTAEHCIAIE